MNKRKLLLVIFALFCVVMANAATYNFYVAEWNESTSTLTFKGTMTDPTGSANVWDVSDTGDTYPGWRNTCYKKARSVVFDESFSEAKPKSCCSWFDGFTLITGITGISYLNTSQVVTMKKMFIDCDELAEIDLSHFDTGNVTDMSSMFDNCQLLKSPDLSSFVTTNVTDMNNMFRNCEKIKTLDLKNFNTAKVTNMNSMFMQSGITSLDVSSFNTSQVTDMAYMFYDAEWINIIDLSSFDTGNVTDMSDMFHNCYVLNTVVLTSFNTSKVTSMIEMFRECRNLKSLDLSSFNVSNVEDFSWMFFGCTRLENLNVANFHLVKAKNLEDMFASCEALTSLTIGSVTTVDNTSMGSMFSGCKSLTSLDLSNFNTSKVTNMTLMFYGCSSLTSVNLSSFDTSNVTNMTSMFRECSSLTMVDLSNFDTNNVVSMERMFYSCSELQTIYVNNLWSTDKLTSTSSSSLMFKDCTKLVGGQGTTYNASKINKEYAHIDGGTSNPGYYTGRVPDDSEGEIISTDDDDDKQDYFKAGFKPKDNDYVEISKVNEADGNVVIPSTVTIGTKEMTVTSIAASAFAGKTSLTTVTIPVSITSIGDGAFSGCSNLELLDLSAANVPSLTSGALSGLSDNTVVVLPTVMLATDAKNLSQGGSNIVYKEGSDYKSEKVALKDGGTLIVPESITSVTASSVTYDREFDRDDVVYSICLPYTQPVTAGLKAYELKEFTSDGNGGALVFQEVSTIEERKPYLITSSGTVSNLTASNVTMRISGDITDTDVTGYQFCGTLDKIPNANATGCLILQGDKMWHPVGEYAIPAGRAYLKPTSGARAITRTVLGGEGATGITTIDLDGSETYYDLQGRRISSPTKAGIYVKDGKKTIVK